MDLHRKSTILVVSVSLLIFLSAAASDNANTRSVLPSDPRITSLAQAVYQDIFHHSLDKDHQKKATTYLYIHEDVIPTGNVAILPRYTSPDINTIFSKPSKPSQKAPRIKPPVTCRTPSVFPSAMDGNLIIGTVARATDILVKLNAINQTNCPVLVIFGRGKFGNKQQDVYGWPPHFIQAKNTVQIKCPATRFFYYINAKPTAEKVLEPLEKNNVNVVFFSDFEHTEL